MQIRVTKMRAEDSGPQNCGKLLHVTWLLEVWPNLVPLTETPIISTELSFAYYMADNEIDLNAQQIRINNYLLDESKRIIDAYITEQTLITTEARIDTAASTLQTALETEYGAN